MIIFCAKAVDVEQNEKGHISTRKKVFIFLMFLSQTENGHMWSQKSMYFHDVFESEF
jgi:hypothetical protein